MGFSHKLRTCLWFDGQAEEAASFYVSLLPDSRVEMVCRPDAEAPAMVVEFILCGAPYMILNGGPMFEPSPAASISVLTKDQAETDALWTALTAHGGEEGRCGWLKDKYGVSLQIVPETLLRLINAPDREKADRARAAMIEMGKIDIAALEAAFQG
ncbi:MAG: VOC family protein [Pseudomonadota bacterium]